LEPPTPVGWAPRPELSALPLQAVQADWAEVWVAGAACDLSKVGSDGEFAQ
jgi:hypothetical protein